MNLSADIWAGVGVAMMGLGAAVGLITTFADVSRVSDEAGDMLARRPETAELKLKRAEGVLRSYVVRIVAGLIFFPGVVLFAFFHGRGA
jgi:hypothetical protein